VVKSVEMYVPTAFTPNHNGLNDVLRPILMGIRDLHYFRVYNRWGELVYESKSNEPPGWDGNFHGVPQPMQVIIWIAEGIGVDGRTYFRKGTSTLIR
jgi:gliding motility-associated-like protein